MVHSNSSADASGAIRHPRAAFGAERLDDHLLEMTESVMQIAQRKQIFDALAPCLADADQQPAGEGNARARPRRGWWRGGSPAACRGAEMRPAAPAKPLRTAFQHQSHRCGRGTQHRQVGRRHRPGIEMRQQARFFEHHCGHGAQIIERRGVTEFVECGAGTRIAQLGLVTEREQRLGAAGRLTLAYDREHVLRPHVDGLIAARRPGKRAVVAGVAAQMRERNEHLARIGDDVAVALVAHAGGKLHQGSGVGFFGERQRPGVRQGRNCGRDVHRNAPDA